MLLANDKGFSSRTTSKIILFFLTSFQKVPAPNFQDSSLSFLDYVDSYISDFFNASCFIFILR